MYFHSKKQREVESAGIRNMDILWLCFFITSSARAQNEGVIKLTAIAPEDYDYLHPPITNSSHPVPVHISINKISIRSIDESDMSFSVTIELWQSWVDHRLRYPVWASEKFQILDSSWIHKLWNPKLYFVNSVDGKLDNIISPSSFFWLTQTNSVYYCSRVILKLICEMDLRYFPHDQQECGIQMASAIYGTLDVVLKWNRNMTTPQLYSLQQFEVGDLDYLSFLKPWGTSNLSCLELQVLLRRRTGYYLINVYIPTILIVIMSMLTFWIPHDAVPARITLGVTSLLTIITKQYQASMPSVSYVVALNVWLSACIGFVFFSLLEFAAVIALSGGPKKNVAPHPPDLPLVMLRSNGTWAAKNNWPTHPFQKRSPHGDNKVNMSPRKLDYFSRFFFPVSFVAFCISYWKCYN